LRRHGGFGRRSGREDSAGSEGHANPQPGIVAAGQGQRDPGAPVPSGHVPERVPVQ